MSRDFRAAAVALTLVASALVSGLHAQTAIKLAKNRYTPQQDVELGRKAAAEVRRPPYGRNPALAHGVRARTEIIDAARELFARNGYQSTKEGLPLAVA